MKALKTALIAILTSAATVIVTNLITGQPLSGLVKLKGLSETFLRSSVPAWAFFRLEAEIKLVRGGAKDGKYLEVWQSPARWRRELTIGEYHYIQVSDPNDDKHSWVVEPSEMAGFGRKTLGFLQLNELDANSWKVGKVFDRDNHGVQLTCIEAKESVG